MAAVINKVSGYRGYTVAWDSVDTNGRVKKCMVSIRFPWHLNNVKISITTDSEDWAAKMGDGSIIPLSNPSILYSNHDSAVVLFDMASVYSANSPMTLVYRKDTAGITVTDTNDAMAYAENMASGLFALTVDAGGGNFTNGYTNVLLATFQFPNQITDTNFEISKGAGDWKARMGDGSTITLSNPEIVSLNSDNAVVKFTMGTNYPSNSPAIILYGTNNAYYKITPKNGETVYTPITDITGVPTNLYVSDVFDLNGVAITPFNATYTDGTWTVTSGTDCATIANNKLTVNKKGTFKIRVSIQNGKAVGQSYTKEFTIVADQNVLSITAQPTDGITLNTGDSVDLTTYVSSSTNDPITYQWYHKAPGASAVAIDNAITSSYKLPKNLEPGSHEFYCVASSIHGAVAVTTAVSHIKIVAKLISFTISPNPLTLLPGETKKLTATPTPTGAELALSYSSTDENSVSVDTDGTVTGILPCSEKIKVTDVSGISAEVSVTVNAYVPVTDIKGVPETIIAGSANTFSYTVEPATATKKTVTWQVLESPGSTGSINGNNPSSSTISASSDGTMKVRATIKQGRSLTEDFTKDFTITVAKAFVPVTSIVLSNSLTDEYEEGDTIILDGHVQPTNATESIIEWSVVTGNVDILGSNMEFTGGGNVTIRGTVKNGKGTETSRSDYTQDFTFTNVHGEFIPVSSVSVDFEHSEVDDPSQKYYNNYLYCVDLLFDNFNGTLEIPITIAPSDATNKNYSISLISKRYGAVQSAIPDVSDVETWINQDNSDSSIGISEKNLTIPNISELQASSIYEITIKVTVTCGSTRTTDFIDNIVFYIVSPMTDPFIIMTDLDIELPNPLRCYYPILITKYKITPDNASVIKEGGRVDDKSIGWLITPETADEDKMAFNTSFYGRDDTHLETIDLPDIFTWGLEEFYCEPVNPGLMSIAIQIFDSVAANPETFNPYNPVLDTFMKTWHNVEVKDPFIPVTNISNIPKQIYKGFDFILSPEVEAGKGTDCYNPYWDDEEPTNQTVKWSIKSNGNTANAQLKDDHIITASNTGKFILVATIDSGVDEELIWYDFEPTAENLAAFKTVEKDKWGRPKNPDTGKFENPSYVNIEENGEERYVIRNVKVDYEQEFEITVVEAPKDAADAFMTLKLKDNSEVKINNIAYYPMLCTKDDENSSITIGDKTFQKKDVTGLHAIGINSDATNVLASNSKVMIPDGFDYTIDNDNFTLTLNRMKNVTNSSAIVIKPYCVLDGILYKTVLGDNKAGSSNYDKTDAGVFSGYNGGGAITIEDDVTFSSGYHMFDKANFSSITFKKVDTSKCTNMECMFRDLEYVEKLDLSSFNTRAVTNMQSMLQSVGSKLTGNKRCTITVGDNFVTYVVTDFSGMFDDANIDTDTLKKIIEKIDVRNAKTLSLMFAFLDYVTSIDISKFHPVKCENFDGMFSQTIGQNMLTTITFGNKFDTKSALFFSSMFEGCDKITELDLTMFNNNNCVDCNSMFASCSALKTVKVGNHWKEEKVSETDKLSMFQGAGCSQVTTGNNTEIDSSDPTYTLPAEQKDDRTKYDTYNSQWYNLHLITTFKNFCRNFTSLTDLNSTEKFPNEAVIPSIGHIKFGEKDDGYYKNFLRGCTAFNQKITFGTVPCKSDHMFEYALRDCKNLNSVVILPVSYLYIDDVCNYLHGFMYGCEKFNQNITIPNYVKGDHCLDKFMYGCTTFNQQLNIPSGVTGYACLMNFMTECTSFNQAITLPTDVSGGNPIMDEDTESLIGKELCNMMKNCHAMCSTITVPSGTAEHAQVSPQSFSSTRKESAIYKTGITIAGDGTEKFLTLVKNSYDANRWPYTHFTNLDE